MRSPKEKSIYVGSAVKSPCLFIRDGTREKQRNVFGKTLSKKRLTTVRSSLVEALAKGSLNSKPSVNRLATLLAKSQDNSKSICPEDNTTEPTTTENLCFR